MLGSLSHVVAIRCFHCICNTPYNMYYFGEKGGIKQLVSPHEGMEEKFKLLIKM